MCTAKTKTIATYAGIGSDGDGGALLVAEIWQRRKQWTPGPAKPALQVCEGGHDAAPAGSSLVFFYFLSCHCPNLPFRPPHRRPSLEAAAGLSIHGLEGRLRHHAPWGKSGGCPVRWGQGKAWWNEGPWQLCHQRLPPHAKRFAVEKEIEHL